MTDRELIAWALGRLSVYAIRVIDGQIYAYYHEDTVKNIVERFGDVLGVPVTVTTCESPLTRSS